MKHIRDIQIGYIEVNLYQDGEYFCIKCEDLFDYTGFKTTQEAIKAALQELQYSIERI